MSKRLVFIRGCSYVLNKYNLEVGGGLGELAGKGMHACDLYHALEISSRFCPALISRLPCGSVRFALALTICHCIEVSLCLFRRLRSKLLLQMLAEWRKTNPTQSEL